MKDMSAKTLPTHRKVAFGLTDRIKGLTPEALALKVYADRANQAWGDIYATHERRMADLSMTEFGRLKSSAEFARGRINDLDRSVSSALEGAEASLGALRSRLDSALRPNDPAQAILDGELRAHLRTLPPDKVLGAVRSDPSMRRAAASAPGALSGLAQTAHEAILAEHLRSVMPEECEQYEDLLEAVSSIGTAMDSLSKYSRELIDFDSVETAA